MINDECRTMNQGEMASIFIIHHFAFIIYFAPAPANALPGLIFTCSPSYRMPLPLYGSGFRTERTCAANWPTACLSAPVTTIFVPSSDTATLPGIGTEMV